MIMSISGFVDTIPVSTLQSVSIIESEFVQAALTGRIRMWISLINCTLPQRSHSMRRNHDGKAHKGRASASSAEGRGSSP